MQKINDIYTLVRRKFFAKVFKLIRTILFLLIVCFISSCQPLLRGVWGVKKPKYETEESLRSYLKEADLSFIHCYTLDSLDWSKVFYNKERTFPDLLLFDTMGNQIPQKGLCIPYSQNFVDALIDIHQRNFVKTNELRTFQDFEKMFRDCMGNSVMVKNSNNYRAIIIWAVFIGKRKGLRQLKKIIYYVNHSHYHITPYFLNVDLQSYWKMKEKVNLSK